MTPVPVVLFNSSLQMTEHSRIFNITTHIAYPPEPAEPQGWLQTPYGQLVLHAVFAVVVLSTLHFLLKIWKPSRQQENNTNEENSEDRSTASQSMTETASQGTLSIAGAIPV